MSALENLLPLASVILGGGITYVVNVRQRRVNYREDLFNDAIAAVNVARASTRFIRVADAERVDLEGDALRDFNRQLKKVGIENEAQKLSQALEALARLYPYLPDVAVYYTDMDGPERLFSDTETIVWQIRQGLAAERRTSGLRRWLTLRRDR